MTFPSELMTTSPVRNVYGDNVPKLVVTDEDITTGVLQESEGVQSYP